MLDKMSRDEAVAKVNADLPKEKRTQKAVVDVMTGRGSIKKIVHQIPGGASLIEEEDGETLPVTIFQWLRRTSEFDRWELSFAGEYSAYEDLKDVKGINTRKKVVIDFDWKPGQAVYWKQSRTGARKGLATQIAKALGDYDNVVSVIVDRSALTVITDQSESFGPDSEHWDPVLLIHTKNR